MPKYRVPFLPFILLVACLTRSVGATEAAALSGELRVWHKITLTFDGPDASEANKDNPFLNYCLSVTFSKGEEKYVVPGYSCRW